MGAACGCDSFSLQPSNSLNLSVVTPSKMASSLKGASARQPFQDIVPAREESTNRMLLNLKEQLETCVVMYERANGSLTNRFVMERVDTDFICQEFEQNLKENSKSPLVQSLNEASLNEEILFERLQDESDSEGQMNNETISSCKLLDPLHVLNESLFTDRLQIKEDFYQVHSCINGRQLQPWTHQNSDSYLVDLDQCYQLKSNNSSLKVCLGALGFLSQRRRINLLGCKQNGIKLHINGRPWLYPFETKNITLGDFEEIVRSVSIPHQMDDFVNKFYMLTGWIPEVIEMRDIKNIQSIFQRLEGSVQECSLVLSFTKKLPQLPSELVLLTGIDIQRKIIRIDTINTPSSLLDVVGENQIGYSSQICWDNLAELYDCLNINWNPKIYELSFKFEGVVKNRVQMQYLVSITSSSEDIEMRLLIERHKKDTSAPIRCITVRLYEYQASTAINYTKADPIKQIQGENEIFSDLIIFESSSEQSEYVLSIVADDADDVDDEVYYTLSVFAFIDIDIIPLKQREMVKSVDYDSYLHPYNMGEGINSPHFKNNLQYAVRAQKGCMLKVMLELPQNHKYEISLIADSERSENITKINLQTLMSNVNVSEVKSGKSTMICLLAYQNYILILNSYDASKGKIKIRLQLYDYLGRSSHELAIRELFCNPKYSFTKQIRWLPTNSGPRKRLRANSTPEYHPLETFQDFFKNPFFDKPMLAGDYQFRVWSETYREQYQAYASKNKLACEPPALSLAVFEISKDKRSFRIILDDAFYVPFGFGFWSLQIQLAEGNYRFVFPQMKKEFGKGMFGIISN